MCALNEYQKILKKKDVTIHEAMFKKNVRSSGSTSPRKAAAYTHQVEVPLKDLQAP